MALIERSLSAAGVEVTTLTSDHGLGAELSPASARINGATRVYTRKWTRWYKVAPGMVVYLARNIAKFDVVHVHALFSFSSTIAAWAARWRGVPYVIRPLGTLGAWGAQNRRRTLKRLSLALIEGPNLHASAAVHFTSEAEREQAAALGLSFRGVVVPLGVDDQGAPGLKTLECGPNVLFLSRLDPKKNLEALIDAFVTCPTLRAAATLRVAGSGVPAYVAALRARVSAAGLDDAVEWLGHVDGARKSAVLAEATLFVLPSFSENFGIAAVEAMLAGLPCLLSPGVAVAGPAAEAGAARLAEPEPTRLAEAMLELLREPEAAREMGASARAFALSTFSTKGMADKLIALYREVAGGKKPR
jgi:glycosyltransferase involved in cell wall biosynthesis